jgi:hypothetical protein
MKIITFLAFIILLQTNSYGQILSTDSSCLQNLIQAKKDYESGQHKFCVNATWDYPFSRMYDVLDSICTSKKIILAPYPSTEHDIGTDPYTCYSNFMDSMLYKEHGITFKTSLINEADSIFKRRVIKDTIPAYYCDKSPAYYKDYEILTSDFFSAFHLPDTCDFFKNCSSCDFRVLFIVDTNGCVSHFEIYNADYSKYACVDLIKVNIIKTLKTIGRWLPGEIGNRKVISYGDVMINIFKRQIY